MRETTVPSGTVPFGSILRLVAVSLTLLIPLSAYAPGFQHSSESAVIEHTLVFSSRDMA